VSKAIYISNFCPLCQQRVQQSAVLNIAEPASGWVVFCQSGAWCHMLSSKDGIERIVYMSMAAKQG